MIWPSLKLDSQASQISPGWGEVGKVDVDAGAKPVVAHFVAMAISRTRWHCSGLEISIVGTATAVDDVGYLVPVPLLSMVSATSEQESGGQEDLLLVRTAVFQTVQIQKQES